MSYKLKMIIIVINNKSYFNNNFQRLKCLVENSEGSFRRKKKPLDFDPFTIYDDVIPFINKQIRNLNIEFKIRNLPMMPEGYYSRYETD